MVSHGGLVVLLCRIIASMKKQRCRLLWLSPSLRTDGDGDVPDQKLR